MGGLKFVNGLNVFDMRACSGYEGSHGGRPYITESWNK